MERVAGGICGEPQSTRPARGGSLFNLMALLVGADLRLFDFIFQERLEICVFGEVLRFVHVGRCPLTYCVHGRLVTWILCSGRLWSDSTLHGMEATVSLYDEKRVGACVISTFQALKSRLFV